MDKIDKFEEEISEFTQRILDMENSFDSI